MKATRLPTIEEVSAKIGSRPGEWMGNCYAIACQIVNAKLVKGVAVYGHWTGYIAPRSFFASKRHLGFCRHGWIILSDGRIMDPTRWVFEGAPPYLYVGAPSSEYDEGGNGLRDDRQKPVVKVGTIRDQRLKLPRKVNLFVRDLLSIDQFTDLFTIDEVLYLANCAYNTLSPYTWPIYSAIERSGQVALIPFDNYQRAEREHKATQHGSSAR